jgi:hypothetical protein
VAPHLRILVSAGLDEEQPKQLAGTSWPPLWITNSFAQQIYMNKSIFNSQEGSVSRKEKQTEQGSTYQQNWGLSTVKICGCRLICRWPIQTEVVGKFKVNLLRKQDFIQINLTHQISRVTKEHVRNTKPTTNYQRHGRRDDVESGRHI